MVFNHLIGVRFPVGPPTTLFFEQKLVITAKLKKIITALFVVKKLPEGIIGIRLTITNKIPDN